MRLAIVTLLFLLTGCASSPFVEARVAYQIDRWSDWVLQSERDWVSDEPVHLRLVAGLEWDKGIDCPYVDVMMAGPWNQSFIGCSKQFGKKHWYAQTQLMHQIDDHTSAFLRTDQKQWQGHNPFFHLRFGAQWRGGKVKCPTIASGKSLFQGAPFESEDGNPDLSWVNVECSTRFWGKTGWN